MANGKISKKEFEQIVGTVSDLLCNNPAIGEFCTRYAFEQVPDRIDEDDQRWWSAYNEAFLTVVTRSCSMMRMFHE